MGIDEMKKSIKERIRYLMRTNKFLHPIYKLVVFKKRKMVYLRFHKELPLRENTIIFEAFQARRYDCSPRGIYEAALKDERFKDFKFIWVVRNVKAFAFLNKKPNTIVIKHNTRRYLRECATAKYIVTNSTLPSYIAPGKDQVVVQTWHGIPLKRLGCDIKSTTNTCQKLPEIHRQYKAQGKKADYFISPSAFYTEKVSSAFNQTSPEARKKFFECGYPRNDFLFSHTKEDVKKVKEKLGIPMDKKVILYAPTFRDNMYETGKGFHYDIGVDFDKLQKELSDEYVILFRTHYFIVDKFDLSKYKGFVYNVSRYSNINHLYIISDMLITDYSSVFFDYANLKRPMLFFMYDYELYKNDTRGFYLDKSDLPGTIVYKMDELCSAIKKTEEEFSYDKHYEEFNERFNTYNDADSGKRALDLFFKNKI